MRIFRRSLLSLIVGIVVLVVLLRWHTHQIDDIRKAWRAGLNLTSLHNVTGETSSELQVALATLGLGVPEWYPRLPAYTPSPASPTAYTKAVVIGKLLSEDVTWLDDADIPSTIQRHIYNVDSNPAPTGSFLLSVPKAKGHEAMVYLTYIISNYDRLADVNIFIHPHKLAWHYNYMLNYDAAEHIKRLSAERVMREGYMNLRCQWDPGCPEHIHPRLGYKDEDKPEQYAIGQQWAEFFPNEDLPDVLGSACCAQFAASKEKIQGLPVEKYERFRKWLLDTDLDDYVSGRVFEYLWHRIFTGQNVHCPDMRACHCDGYGFCFEDEKEFDYWFQLRHENRMAEKELTRWQVQAKNFDRTLSDFRNGAKRIHDLEKAKIDVPAVDGDVILQKKINRNSKMMEEMRLKALRAGTDPSIRARLSGREWKEGDGF